MRTRSRPKKPEYLTSSFWSRFVRDFWEKTPLVIDRISTPFESLSEDSVFPLLLKATDKYRDGSYSHVRFYIGTTSIDQLDQFLPENADGSIHGYSKRIKSKLNGQSYTLVLNDVQYLDYKIWKHECSFLSGLYKYIGFPTAFSESAVFLGDYEGTPFGVHKDQVSSFYFPIIGKKRFRVWDNKFVQKNPRLKKAENYIRFLDNSTVLEATPGGIIYWPSSNWHIAESTGEFTLALGIGIWVDSGLEDFILPIFQKLISTCLSRNTNGMTLRFTADNLSTGRRTLPKNLEITKNLLIHALNALDLDLELQKYWLDKISSYGFDKVPFLPETETPLNRNDFIALDSFQPIYWMQDKDQTMIVSSNGVTFSIVSDPKIPKLLKLINAGKKLKVNDLLGRYSSNYKIRESQADSNTILELLEMLMRIRAIDKC